MQKKMKLVSKIICVSLLTIILFSTECFARDISPYGLSGYRCPNSTCGGAYLEELPVVGITCQKCGSVTQVHRCKTCGKEYDICSSGHINTPY